MIEKPSYEELYQKVYAAEVHMLIDLGGPWRGWKIRGQYLVTPEKERIPVRELVGLVIHYRAKFGHHRARRQVDAGEPSNVIPFARAAAAQLEAKYEASRSRDVGAEPLRAP